MNNIQAVSDSYLCTACGACGVVCNKEAISFQWSSLGRKYAYIDSQKCVNCGQCITACPTIDTKKLHTRFSNKYLGNILHVYTGRAVDKEVFGNSQSGGVLTAVVQYLFESGKIDAAIMCRMLPGNPSKVVGVMVEHECQLQECQRSCYTPVDILTALQSVKTKRSVAVIGLPCHIQGATLLYEQFKRFDNISYRLGLICDRTLCAGIMSVFSSYVGKGEKIIQWRKKDFCKDGIHYDYKNAPVVFLNSQKRIIKNGILPNSYRFALKDMFTSPRCRVCYDKLNTHSDVVFGDPWGMSNIDWTHGENVVLTRTEKGQHLIEEVFQSGKVQMIERVDVSEVISGQHIDIKPEQVAIYSKALSVLPISVDSYIFRQTEDCSPIDFEKVKRAEKELEAFVSNESLTLEQIVRLGRTLIRRVENTPSLWQRIRKYLGLLLRK